MKPNFVFVTYFWGGSRYKELANRWKDACKRNGVHCHVEEMQQFSKKGMYQIGINYKPQFISKMLAMFPTKGVVYTDIDTVLCEYPKLFENPDAVDMMCINWNFDPAAIQNGCIDPLVMETAGTIMYFNNTKHARKVLRLWQNALSLPEYLRCADDRVLAMTFHKHKLVMETRVQWLPLEYLYIQQYFDGAVKNPVVCHPERMTTEEHAARLGASTNRIPDDYRVQYSVRNKTTLLLNKGSEHHSLEKRLKEYGFKFVTVHKLPSASIRCTRKGVVRFPHNVTPDEVVSFWESENGGCDIVIGKYAKKHGLDFASNGFLDNGLLKLTRERSGLYLRRNNLTYTLVKHWAQTYKKLKDPQKSLEVAFNTNATNRLRMRYGNM